MVHSVLRYVASKSELQTDYRLPSIIFCRPHPLPDTQSAAPTERFLTGENIYFSMLYTQHLQTTRTKFSTVEWAPLSTDYITLYS